MLDYKILDYKYIVDTSTDSYIDLMSTSFNMPKTFGGAPMVVNKYYVARPDLISLAVYGTDEYADIICKINGISNPFELNEDDLIYLPDIEILADCCEMADNKDEVVDPSDIILQEKPANSYQKKKNERRSSNEQVEGDNIFVIDKTLGLIFF